MTDLILDASILIDYSRGSSDARGALQQLEQSNRLVTHFVVVAEVLAGARDRADMRELRAMLDPLKCIIPNRQDLEGCLTLVRGHTLADGVGWPDCLIAASARRLGLGVVTLNAKHFRRIRGLNVVVPY